MSDRDRDFIREVDEAVRQDRYKKLWDQYGIYALAAAVVLVAGVAGYKGWNSWQERKSGEAGAKFTQALTLQDGPDAAKAKEIFDQLVSDGPEGYRTLSRFQLAASEAKSGDPDKAVADYDALASDMPSAIGSKTKRVVGEGVITRSQGESDQNQGNPDCLAAVMEADGGRGSRGCTRI